MSFPLFPVLWRAVVLHQFLPFSSTRQTLYLPLLFAIRLSLSVGKHTRIPFTPIYICIVCFCSSMYQSVNRSIAQSVRQCDISSICLAINQFAYQSALSSLTFFHPIIRVSISSPFCSIFSPSAMSVHPSA